MGGGFKWCHDFSTHKDVSGWFEMRRALPEPHSVAQGRVPVAILSVDRGPETQQVLDHFEVALGGRDVKRRASVIVTMAQVASLFQKKTSIHHYYYYYAFTYTYKSYTALL